jgi:hypothetical protein
LNSVKKEIESLEKNIREHSDEVDVLMLDTLQTIVRMKELKASGFFQGDEEKKDMYIYEHIHCKNYG